MYYLVYEWFSRPYAAKYKTMKQRTAAKKNMLTSPNFTIIDEFYSKIY